MKFRIKNENNIQFGFLIHAFNLKTKKKRKLRVAISFSFYKKTYYVVI